MLKKISSKASKSQLEQLVQSMRSFQKEQNAQSYQQIRLIGSGFPELFGKKSKYSAGTDFLGTPKDHQKLLRERPMSPDVFEGNTYQFHYIFPIQAISSIMNRVTGCMLSGELAFLALVAVFGDLHACLDLIKSTVFLLVPAKFLIAFPLSYHTLGGLRHLMWDFSSIGKQSSKNSTLEKGATKQQSQFVLFGALGLSLLLSVYSTSYRTKQPKKESHSEAH